MSHSPIAPSAAHAWGKPGGCTAYPRMVALHPEEEETIEQREGTAAHEIGQDLINQFLQGRYETRPETWVGQTASNGVVWTDEMFESALEYANDVLTVMRKTGVFNGGLSVEQKVYAPQIHEQSYGTPDCVLYHKAGGMLYVWDFKHGRMKVEAFENWQLINYAAGIMHGMGVDGSQDQHLKVNLRVVQPRAYHYEGTVRSWECFASDLRPYINQLHTAAHECFRDDAETRTGAHCRYCPARTCCQAAIDAGVQLFEAASAPMPIEMTPAATGTQLAIIKRARAHLESLESGFEERVKYLIKKGHNVPGFIAREGKGHDKWTKPIEEVETLGDVMKIELRKQGLITPKQARDAGLDAGIVAQYSEAPKTGIKIIADDGTRARQIFSKKAANYE